MWLFAKGIELKEPDGGRIIIRFPRHWEREFHPGTSYMFRDGRTDTILQLIVFPREPELSTDQVANLMRMRVEIAAETALSGSLQLSQMVSSDGWGSYCWSKDRNVKPGEYAWMTQGYFLTGGRTFDFQILSHRPPPKATQQAFEILETLRIIQP